VLVLKLGVDKGGEAGEVGGMPGDRSSGLTCSLAVLFTPVLAPAGNTIVSWSVCDDMLHMIDQNISRKPDAGLRVVERSRSASWQFVGESAARTTQPPHCQLHETEMFLKTPAACQARVQRLRACLTLL